MLLESGEAFGTWIASLRMKFLTKVYFSVSHRSWVPVPATARAVARFETWRRMVAGGGV